MKRTIIFFIFFSLFYFTLDTYLVDVFKTLVWQKSKLLIIFQSDCMAQHAWNASGYFLFHP
ncbi:Uncharacterised protein [Segatella copri]|nr:Uncharacterised protein [Segatella copri]